MSGITTAQTIKSETVEKYTSGNIRLTPTGKISHAKSRIYTQRYRKDWEQTPEFRGWLAPVPGTPTRAYCIYCKKDLHAHRLSLLKHTCTMKHQRSALIAESNANESNLQTISVKYIDINEDQGKEDYTNFEYLDSDFHEVEMKNVIIDYDERNEESFEEIEDESNNLDHIEDNTLSEIKINRKTDALTEAMAHIHSDNEEEEQQETIEMVQDYDDSENTEQIVNSDTHNNVSFNNIVLSNEVVNKFGDDIIIIKPKACQNSKKYTKKVFIQENCEKDSHAVIVNEIKTAPETTLTLKPVKNIKELTSKFSNTNSEEIITTKSNVLYKKSCITTHVSDTSKGIPVAGLQVSLYKLIDGKWIFMNESNTMINGYCNDLVNHENTNFTSGRYKLHYDVGKYFTYLKVESMFPFIEIVIDVKNAAANYHIPILLSPFGYTCYRGFEK